MEQLESFKKNFISKLVIFTITFSALYFMFDTYQVTYKNYKSMEETLKNRIEHSSTLRAQINEYEVKIENLNDPEKLDLILQELLNLVLFRKFHLHLLYLLQVFYCLQLP